MNAEAAIVSELLANGDIRPDELRRAEAVLEPGTGVLAMLEKLGLLSEQRQALATAHVLHLPLADPANAPELAPDIQPVSMRFLRQFQLIPVRLEADGLEVWSAQAHVHAALDAMRIATEQPLKVKVASRSVVTALLDRWYPEVAPDTADGDGESSDLEDVEHLRDMASEAPVIRIVNQILQRAAELGASDIHLEPFERQLKLRYRIDGVLEDMESPPVAMAAAILSRFKILAKLDIAERRLPQDGRIQLRVQGRELDLRASTVPTTHGESLVLRLLDREAVQFDLAQMGFSDHLRAQFEEVLQQPHGIVLVTGPTGSGKTTTLYAALSQLNTPHVKIITVEDPVEYRMEGVNQIQVKPQIGLDFSHALRSIVRQDPDIILVGEMRDIETARTAIQSALTGHLVLSTLHTNSAAGGLTRLRDMGIENYLVASTVNALLAQRLVRRIESTHAQPYLASESEIERFSLRRYQPQGDIVLHRPVPSALTPTGYRGRVAIAELVLMSDALSRAVMDNAATGALERIAREEGSASMAEDGIRKALAGLTTLEEVMRVTQADRE
ncbi:GspE/PulE family protein [Solilutibacter silvestris]|uniref:Type II secretory pathway ATPase PulE/Tfp pilus assembly pathway n=1 Tax=Solilutibacter silvestris TaxID=1645665 RepID=A0A2K1Q484_9GAMM|nr:ATPase, T2SS/T4P/T4SS family [Lysobacter silvestris]PNS09834.1 Type II secretory pathway ATPase PulE/Tfp pilus assembly pathway [Lysobacter silvestris]